MQQKAMLTFARAVRCSRQKQLCKQLSISPIDSCYRLVCGSVMNASLRKFRIDRVCVQFVLLHLSLQFLYVQPWNSGPIDERGSTLAMNNFLPLLSAVDLIIDFSALVR